MHSYFKISYLVVDNQYIYVCVCVCIFDSLKIFSSARARILGFSFLPELWGLIVHRHCQI